MAVIALSIEPYAVAPGFLRRLCRETGLGLVDFAPFERGIAQGLSVAKGDIMTALGAAPAVRAWPMTASDFVARVGELALEAALDGNVVINGWMACAALRPLNHIPCVRLTASARYRASNLQRHLRYAHLASAELELESDDCIIDCLSTILPNGNLRAIGQRDLTIDTETLTEDACLKGIAAHHMSQTGVETSAVADAINGRLRELR